MDEFYEQIHNAENHSEIINGTLVVQDKTTTTHNIAVTEIASAIKNHISSNNGKCKVFTENVALYINELCGNNDYFLPDVMVVCDEEGIQEDGVHSVPLFIAEVTSESTKSIDYGYKKEIYKSIGVEEYWIVDIQRNMIEKHLLSKEYISDCYIHPEAMKVTVYGFVTDVSSFIK